MKALSTVQYTTQIFVSKILFALEGTVCVAITSTIIWWAFNILVGTYSLVLVRTAGCYVLINSISNAKSQVIHLTFEDQGNDSKINVVNLLINRHEIGEYCMSLTFSISSSMRH